jgi:hypothetical protein
MYTESSLVAICLPEKAIAEEAKTIAQGLYARHIAHDEKAIEPLTMLHHFELKSEQNNY